VFKGNTVKALLNCHIDDFRYSTDKYAFKLAMKSYNNTLIGDTYVTYGDVD